MANGKASETDAETRREEPEELEGDFDVIEISDGDLEWIWIWMVRRGGWLRKDCCAVDDMESDEGCFHGRVLLC